MKAKVCLVVTLFAVFSLQSIFSIETLDSKADIEKLFTQWNTSLQTGSPEKVANNYAADAILIPTISNKIRHNHKDIKDYFEHFLTKKPVGIIDEENIRIFGDIAINSGLYTFDIVVDTEKAYKYMLSI
ncbi:MAG: SgcJ/EcaC family oxidoreductase [Candidatus Woesearchaeota archaeon]